MKETIKAIALDLDGTLLNSRNEISDYNKKIINKLKNDGIEIILCTGRPYNAMKKFRDELGLDNTVICFNGASVIDSEGNILLNTFLDNEICRELVRIGRERNIFHHGFMDTRWLVPYFNETTQGYKDRSGLTETIVNFDDIVDLKFIKMMYIGNREILDSIHSELEEKFGDRIYKAFSTTNYLEVLNSHSSKAKALDFYLKKLGLSRDNLLVMGDGYNDLEMLKYAKVGVVMENAPVGLKSEFDYIAPDNNEDGVGKFLKDFFSL